MSGFQFEIRRICLLLFGLTQESEEYVSVGFKSEIRKMSGFWGGLCKKSKMNEYILFAFFVAFKTET